MERQTNLVVVDVVFPLGLLVDEAIDIDFSLLATTI